MSWASGWSPRPVPWAGALVIPAFNGLWPRWRRALIPAARRGVLCFGPDRGRNVTYTSPRRWLPGFVPRRPGGEPGSGPPLSVGIRTRHAGAVRAVAVGSPPMGHASCSSRLARAGGGRRRGMRGVAAGRGRRRCGRTSAPARSGCCPTSTPTPSAAIPASGCSRGSPRRALSGGQAGNVPVLLVDGIVGGVWHQRRAGGGCMSRSSRSTS